MTFFYDLNKKLQQVLETPKSENKQLNERDEGKHNNATTGFKALADKAAKEYGSKAAGERVAGAVRNKMKKAGKLEEGDMEESAFQAAIGKKKYGDEGMKALQKAGREHASAKTMSNIRNKYDKYDESMEEGMFDSLKAGMSKAGKVAKVVAKKGLDTLGHGSDEAMRKDLQKKMGLPPTGKKPVGEGDFGPMEGGAPMTAKQKSFAKLAPPKDKITFADKIAGAKKEVDEMLGDVAAEAMRGALKGGQKKLDKNHNGKLDAQDFAMLRAGKNKQETDEGSDWSQLGKEYSRPKIGSVERGAKHDIEHTATGRRVTRRTDDQGISVGADDEAGTEPVKRGRGRPKGTGKAMGAKGPSGKSKLMKRESDQELDEKAVSKKQQKFMGMVHAAQKGEKPASKEVAKVAKTMKKKDAEDFASTKHKGLPEKVKKTDEEKTTTRDNHAEKAGKKVTKDIEYDEKVKDKIHGKKRGAEDAKAERAGKKVTKDIEYDEKKSKKKEKTEEAGGTGTPTASSGFSFGKGIYDSLNREIENIIAESMSINASDSTDGTKSLTITATEEDAIKLAEIVRNAGIGGMGDHEHSEEPCEVCGSEDCGCGDIEEAVGEAYGDTDETLNKPNWPTDTETSDDAFQYSGGLNKPKSTGQTTVPVIAHQDSRMGVDGDEELRRMMEMAGLQSDLKPWEKTMKEEVKEEEVEEAKEEELDEAQEVCEVCEAVPCKCDESVEESIARFRSLAGLKEAAKPDYIDLDKDGDKEESMKQAADDKEKSDKKVEESIFKMTNLWKAYKG